MTVREYSYLDDILRGAIGEDGAPGIFPSVRYADDSTGPVSGLYTVDGSMLVAGDMVIKRGMGGDVDTPHVNNGPWVAGPGAWERPSWFQSGDEFRGLGVLVVEGTTKPQTIYVCVPTSWGSHIVGTDAMTCKFLPTGLLRQDGTAPLIDHWNVGGKAIKNFVNAETSRILVSGGAGMTALLTHSFTDIIDASCQLYAVGVRVTGMEESDWDEAGFGDAQLVVRAKTNVTPILDIVAGPVYDKSKMSSNHDLEVDILGSQIRVQADPGTNATWFYAQIWYQTPKWFSDYPL